MRFFDRLSNGWRLGMTSLGIIKENVSLLLFPVMSTIALVMICLTFFGWFYALFGTDIETFLETAGASDFIIYLVLFLFYLVNFSIIIFFNVGLVHCARLILSGKEAKVSDGLAYSAKRLPTILSWAILSATVGIILKMIEERFGWIGQIVAGIIGLAWSATTYFVVPVIAYEDVTPIEALKRSAQMLKEKWGEAIGANFSFSVFYILGYLLIGLVTFLMISVNPIIAIAGAVMTALLLHTVVSAAKMVFLAATYQHMTNEPVPYFDSDTLDSAFIERR